MVCSACGTDNEAGRKFCKECGTPLAIACQLEARTEEASSGYRHALDSWNSLDIPLDYAFCAIDMTTLAPGDELTGKVAARAREILEGLGARPLLERLSLAERPATAEAT